MKIAKDMRGWLGRLVATAAAFCVAGAAVYAQGVPGSVLIFPAHVDGAANNPSAKLASRLVTEAVRRNVAKLGIGVVVYDKSLPSVQRAIQEAEKGLKADDAMGPGDDPRRARTLAEVAGAPEYIVAIIDDYKYDAKTRTATFNLSLTRSNTADGVAINTVANKQSGSSPADVAPSRQEGSAVVRAADAGADQGVSQLYPDIRVDPLVVKPVRSRTRLEKYAVPGFVLGLGVLFFSTR
jgi:hypothetical protein